MKPGFLPGDGEKGLQLVFGERIRRAKKRILCVRKLVLVLNQQRVDTKPADPADPLGQVSLSRHEILKVQVEADDGRHGHEAASF